MVCVRILLDHISALFSRFVPSQRSFEKHVPYECFRSFPKIMLLQMLGFYRSHVTCSVAPAPLPIEAPEAPKTIHRVAHSRWTTSLAFASTTQRTDRFRRDRLGKAHCRQDVDHCTPKAQHRGLTGPVAVEMCPCCLVPTLTKLQR